MLRLVGLAFLVLGLLVLAWDIISPPAQGFFSATGERWAEIHRESLLLLQAGLQRHVHAGLWDYAVQPILQWPLALELWALAGLCLLAAALRRR